jgi:hypothetical protein
LEEPRFAYWALGHPTDGLVCIRGGFITSEVEEAELSQDEESTIKMALCNLAEGIMLE